MEKKKIVVAYSGGLDTSFTIMYLARECGYEVYAACADTGGSSPAQLRTNEENAYKLGAKAYVTLDVKQEYYRKSIKYMVFGNVLRGGTYPISVSSERIFQAIAIARYAREIGASAIAHAMKTLHENAFLCVLRDVVFSHHERWDGTGYPLGLSGQSIPLSGRIMAIPDVYDALGSKRPYKEPFSHEKAVRIIREGIGTHFDPLVGEAFLRCEQDFARIAQEQR